MWTGMSCVWGFLAVLLRRGAGQTEEGPSGLRDASRLTMDRGCEESGASGDILVWGVFTLYWP